ncbi:MAG: hypothetical protein HY736_07950 [Verrucomicrobia bacterium]|nr:hypothetical protein [Verrucomicrobiota bacterium]
MPRSVILSPLLLTAVFAAGLTSGSPAQTAPAQSPVLNPAPAEQAPSPARKRPRAISADVAAQLAATMPKYTPPPPKPEPKPEEEQVDLRDIDKPKNTIIRLPKYVVQEPKPPVFSERAISTKKGLTDIAMRRYITEADRALNRFTLPLFGISAEARALAMYAEDERLKNMADLDDAANTVSKSDAAAGVYVRREAQKTYLRSSDFGWNGGSRK